MEQLMAGAMIELGDPDFTFRESIGNPSASLREIADEEGADVLVLGHTHRGLFGRVAPGTTAERLISQAPCPIAVAPRGYAQHSPETELGLIGVAYDGSRASREALAFAAILATATGGEIEILSADPNYVDPDVPLGPLRVLDGEAQQRVDRALARVPYNVQAGGEVMQGDAATALEERGIELDFLVMGARGRGPVKTRLLGSVSADVIRNAPCPVIVVPEGAAS
jgi:nucleotide-binding universal stress UspA family protein